MSEAQRGGVREVSVPAMPAGLSASETPDWVALATWGFVGLGMLLRLSRYLLNFPLWCDESMIAANFLDRDYAGLLRPLDYRQVAPVGFLMIELSAVKLLGFSEFTLRLFPMLCAVISVPLTRHVASRFLKGLPLLLAVAIFAVSAWPLRYAGEVKPYASDLFVALGLLAMAVEASKALPKTGWLWALALTAPLAVSLSFPSLFVLGGISLALAWPLWSGRHHRAWVPYFAMGIGTLAAFVALAPFYQTAPQDHDYFHHDWAPAFPPLNPIRFVGWFLTMNTGYMFSYPIGGERGASSLTFLAFVVAAWALWKRGNRVVLALGLAPFGLALVAAAMHRYPYGMSPRTMQYAAPIICLFAGLGAATMIGWLPSLASRLIAARTLALGLAVLGVGLLIHDQIHPYKTPTDERYREFSRWFWTEKSRGAELVCVGRELGVAFDDRHWSNDATDTYLCYQKIYSPRHRQGEPPRLDRVSADHPLRCVLFNEYPQNTPKFQSWMSEMLQRYTLNRLDLYPISTLERKRGPTWNWVYTVYEFTPKTEGAVAAGIEASYINKIMTR